MLYKTPLIILHTMARKPRLSVPGALHHVMARGIEGKNIFVDDEDRRKFLFLLETGFCKTGFKCYAWVLMNNHYHLLIRVNENPISQIMKPLNSNYARWFRKKTKSRGYLFQDRFKSLVTQDQGYIEQLVRYIHLNPLRAGMCKNLAALDQYQWCGHAALVGTKKFAFQDSLTVLNRFGTGHEAVESYRSFLIEGINEEGSGEFVDTIRKASTNRENKRDHRMWVIGDSSFVRAALEHDRLQRLVILQRRSSGWTLGAIAKHLAHKMKLEADQIHNRGRNNDRSRFRKIFAALSNRDCGFSVSEIARFLGIGSSSVSRMLDSGRRFAKELNLFIEQ